MDFCLLVVADRFTGSVSIHYLQKEVTALQLIDCLKTFFVTFGVPEFLATDHGSQFQALEIEKFLQTWGVKHRVSLDYNPNSNLRAKIAVKTAKRMLIISTKSDGSPIWNKVYQAALQHRKTAGLGLSPAQLIFARPIKDFLPVLPGQLSKPNPNSTQFNITQSNSK